MQKPNQSILNSSNRGKYFWMPSGDGTIIYVKEIYDGLIFKNKIRRIAYFHSDGDCGFTFEQAKEQAEDLIERLSNEKR